MKTVGSRNIVTYEIGLSEFVKAFKIKGNITGVYDFYDGDNDSDVPDGIRVSVEEKTGMYAKDDLNDT